MNINSNPDRTAPRHAKARFPLTLLLLLALCTPVLGQSLYLASRAPDGIALLPPPPASGSAEEAADLAEARSVFNGRTPADEARATKSSGLAFSLFGPAIGPIFDPVKLPRTEALLQKIKKDIGAAIDSPKNYFKRRRPYQMDDKLSLGKPEPSFSYPSGHSTRGTVYAMVLAELFPEKKEPVLEVGREIGWDRVIIGKHFPTDVYAGRVLGQAIVVALKASPEFQHDLAEAKAEIKAATN
jgi:acid phosphatase (class A)